jgi:hypothetical protein
MFELPQLLLLQLNFQLQELQFTLLDGETLQLVDLHPITSSLLDSLTSVLPLVIQPMAVYKQTFKFAPEEMSDKILAKETVVVLSSLPQTHQTPLMQQSLVLFHLEETNVLSMNLEFIPISRALQMPSFKV